MTKRYAIYYSPASNSPLWQFGCRWLGRDPEQNCDWSRYSVPGFTTQEMDALTSSPRQYGFHATLKPPFRLASGTTEEDLYGSVKAFSRECQPFILPPLQFDRLGGFLALRPATRSDPLHALADACVRQFERFRRPTDPTELQGRRTSGLTQRQEALLGEFGYPYVFDQYRFHLTLTGRLDNETAARLRPWLELELGPVLLHQERVAELCVFVQDAADGLFRLDHRTPFGAR